MTWVEVYTRCMDGEYFRGANCPLDGSTSNSSVELARLTSEMRVRGERISVQALMDHGFSEDWSEVMVVEVMDEDHAPDWLRPNG
jgi:hypothetical protein